MKYSHDNIIITQWYYHRNTLKTGKVWFYGTHRQTDYLLLTLISSDTFKGLLWQSVAAQMYTPESLTVSFSTTRFVHVKSLSVPNVTLILGSVAANSCLPSLYQPIILPLQILTHLILKVSSSSYPFVAVVILTESIPTERTCSSHKFFVI